jgi:hypothetical protein
VQQPHTYLSSQLISGQQQQMSSQPVETTYLHQGQLLSQQQWPQQLQPPSSSMSTAPASVFGQDAVAPGVAAVGFHPFIGTQPFYNVPSQSDGQGSGSCGFGYF